MVPSRTEAYARRGDRTAVWTLGGWLAAGAVILAAAAVGAMSPRAVLKATSRGIGLAHVRWESLAGAVTHASFRSAFGSVALVAKDGILVPKTPIPPGVSGTVRVHIVGPSLLAWLPWDHREVTDQEATPRAPKPTGLHAARSLNGDLPVTFTHPVSAVTYTLGERTRTVVLPRPERTVDLAVPPSHPGARGTIQVTARARTWETEDQRTTTVDWSTVPYLTASPTSHPSIPPTGSLTVDFSAPLARADLARWKVLPAAAGRWTEISPRRYRFAPTGPLGFGPGALVAVEIPGGASGPMTSAGSYLAKTTTLDWTTPPGSVLRLQQLLAQAGYLPASWTPAPSDSDPTTLTAETATVYHPLPGAFHWKYPNLPAALHTLWTPGQMSVVTQGAVMQFERVNGLPVDGVAGPNVWEALMRDAIRGKVSPDGYTYVSVTENEPETLELWVNGKLILKSSTNTGIPQTPTALGTHAIYWRIPFQIMQGTNPNGTPYADPVHWINYFDGGDAVHGFYRAAYGFPQSLGCVELPLSVAPVVYHAVHYGTLVTVSPVGIPPAPAEVPASTGASSARANVAASRGGNTAPSNSSPSKNSIGGSTKAS